jgi:putative SOS response-associated peptidase YedK
MYSWRVLWSEESKKIVWEGSRYVLRGGRGVWLPLSEAAGPSGFEGYNQAPGMMQPILVEERDGTWKAQSMRWGLIRPWSKPGYAKPREARSETIMQLPMFRDLVPAKRCIVTMSGYFEWRKEGRRKIPYHIRRVGEEQIRAAGLYDLWWESDGSVAASYCLVTSPAAASIARIKDRMPVILQSQAEEELWLSPSVSDFRAIRGLCRPCPPEWLTAYPASDLVNDWRNQGPEVLRPRVDHMIQLPLPI